MLYDQLLFANDKAPDWGQVLVSRGTCNGLYLLLEKWEEAYNEHRAKSIKEPEVDKNNPLLKNKRP